MPEINLQDVPGPILRKLAQRAKRDKVGISTLINRILAQEFGVEEGAVRSGEYRGGGQSTTLVVTVSDEVRAALRMEGPGKGGTIRGVTLTVLAGYFGLKPPVLDRRNQRGKAGTRG